MALDPDAYQALIRAGVPPVEAAGLAGGATMSAEAKVTALVYGGMPAELAVPLVAGTLDAATARAAYLYMGLGGADAQLLADSRLRAKPDRYVSPTGSDAADGLTPTTAWATLSKVNAASLTAGQTVGLARGGVWHEQLVPKAGVTYQPYGSGTALPSVRASVTKNSAGDWTSEAAGGSNSGTYRPSAGTDDAQYGANDVDYDASSTNIGLGGFNGADSQDSLVTRMAVNVPQGATVTAANLTLRSSNAGNGGTLHLVIRAEAADDPTMPTTNAAAKARSLTTASVTWDITTWTLNSDFSSPDISAVIQEIVNRPGWVAGQHINIYAVSTGSDSGKFRAAVSYDSSTTNCPRLAVTYSVPSSTLWYASGISADPYVFTHDGVLGNGTQGMSPRKTLKTLLTTAWDYWYDTGNSRLYVKTPGDVNPTSAASLLELGAADACVTYNGDNSWVLDELEFRHARVVAVAPYSSTAGPTIKNCTIKQVGTNGIQWNGGATGGKVTGCSFEDWNLSDTDGGFGIHIIGIATESKVDEISHNSFNQLRACLGLQSDPIEIDEGGWADLIAYNTLTNCHGGNGIVVYRPADAKGTSMVIEHNSVTRADKVALALTNLEYRGSTPKSYLVRYNTLVDSARDDGLDVEALRLRDFTTVSTVTVHHNLVSGTLDGDNVHDGIRVTDAQGAKLYHNTVYGTDVPVVLDGGGTRNSSATARNNLAAGNRSSDAVYVTAGATLTEDHNDWYGAATGFTPAATSLNADPLFTNPAAGDFSLGAGSPARNAGAVIAGITTGYFGGAPDLGHLES